LEIGVGGEGGLIISLKDNNEVIGADVSDSAIKNCQKFGLNVIKANLDKDNLHFQNDYFDIIFAFEVFEHFSNPQQAIEEIHRILKPGGILLISIPNTLTYHWPRLFYPSLFEKNNFKEFLMINEFEVEADEDFSLFDNIYSNKRLDKKYKLWSNFYFSKKITPNNSKAFFESGLYFWEKRNNLNLRISPIEAVDLFRKLYLFDKNNYKAKLYLTHTLLYRLLFGEYEEFNIMYNNICTEIHNVLESNDFDKITEYLYFYLALQIEGNYFGLNFLQEELNKKFESILSKLPKGEIYIQKLNTLSNIYKNEVFNHLP